MDKSQQENSSKIPLFVLGGEEYRLGHIEDIEKLGERLIKLYVHLYPTDESQFFLSPPHERTRLIQSWVETVHGQIEKSISLKNVKPLWNKKRREWGFECEILPVDFISLMRQPNIRFIRIISIEGMKPKRSRRSRKLEWYGVKARFIIQHEGETKGTQLYEDRILLVKAESKEDAERRLQKEFEEYSKPYLNMNHELVRWQFERVLDVSCTYFDRFDPEGTEVFSSFGGRRMRPEYEWHPLRDREEKTE